jgi:hypothetical protein
VAALGGAARVTAVLLTATDSTARERLAGREIGSELEAHVERSGRAARRLEAEAPASVHRVATDGRTVVDIAREVVALTGWLATGA